MSFHIARPEDAARLADLYARLFRHTGFANVAAPDKRDELVAWLEKLCAEGKLSFVDDEKGPITLCHFEPEKNEVIGLVTRDGMERRGYGEKLLSWVNSAHGPVKMRPVTREGKAFAAKVGFVAGKNDPSVWEPARVDPPVALDAPAKP